MRTRAKFAAKLVNFTLKDIKRLEVKFDPFHKNAENIREFYHGATHQRALRTNPECIYKATIVSDRSDPLITVKFQDNHDLVINSAHLESTHILQLIDQFKLKHASIEDGQETV